MRGALPSLSKGGLEWHLMKETDDAGLGVSQKSIVRASSQCFIRVQGRTLLPRVVNRIEFNSASLSEIQRVFRGAKQRRPRGSKPRWGCVQSSLAKFSARNWAISE